MQVKFLTAPNRLVPSPTAAAASAATLPAFSSVSHRPLGSPLLTADRLQSEQKEEEGGQDLHCKLQ